MTKGTPIELGGLSSTAGLVPPPAGADEPRTDDRPIADAIRPLGACRDDAIRPLGACRDDAARYAGVVAIGCSPGSA